MAARPEIDLEVFFCRDFGVRPRYDKQFAQTVQWDTDQLSGYRSRFLLNVSPITDTFNPLHAINPGAFMHMLRGFDAVWMNGYMYPSNWLAAAAAGLENGSDEICFRTSGSSGAPKTCRHSLAGLWQEAAELAALFPGTRRIVGLVPSHHIYGFLFTVLLPRALGLEPEAFVDLRGSSPGAVARQLRTGDLVVFGTGRQPSHAGIYVGEGRFVHAPSTGGTVRLDHLQSRHWARQNAAFRRP